MAKWDAKRFHDNLVEADADEAEDILVTIDRDSPEYHDGAQAAREGRPRDIEQSLNWILGYDEAEV